LPAAVSARGYSDPVLRLQILDLVLCQRPPMPAGQIAEAKITDSNAEQIFDAVSDGLKHASNLSIYSLSQGDAKTRGRQGAKPRNLCALTIEKNPAFQLRCERRIPRSIQCDLIFFINLEPRMRELLR
jgi:hypothetical protein